MGQAPEVARDGLRSGAPEHQEIYDSVPLGLFYFYDASKAALLPMEPSNNDVYYAIAGDDADFTIGGDIAKLDFRTDLRKLTMPILVIAGRYDRISLPQYAVKYKTYAPQARFVMMEKSGHFAYIEEPEKMLSVLTLGKPITRRAVVRVQARSPIDLIVRKALVRSSGFEPPRYCYRQPLKLVRLPVPPRPHKDGNN